MKVRSAVLIACLIVVPMVALVSHRVPASFRALVRERVGTPLGEWLTGLFDRSPVGPEEPATPPPIVAAAEPPAITPVTVPVTTAPASTEARALLERLGAVAIECLLAAEGCQASCRVPVDTGGELHRVFQVTAADETTALRGLGEQVDAWSRRRAARAATVTAERLPVQTLRF